MSIAPISAATTAPAVPEAAPSPQPAPSQSNGALKPDTVSLSTAGLKAAAGNDGDGDAS